MVLSWVHAVPASLSSSLLTLVSNQAGFELDEGVTVLVEGSAWSKIWKWEETQAAQGMVRDRV